MTLRNLCGAVCVLTAAVVQAQQPAMAPPPGYFSPPRVYTQPNPYAHPAGYVQQPALPAGQQFGQPLPMAPLPQPTGANAAAANMAPSLAATPNTNGVFDPFATSKTVHTPGSNMFNQPGNFVTGWKFPVWNRLKNRMGY